MTRRKVLDVARLIGLAYDKALTGVAVEIHEQGADAYLLRDGTLVLPGVNEGRDWQFAADLWPAKGSDAGWLPSDNGLISKEKWFGGFALHAALIRWRMGARKPGFIVGHSLGAAAAQFLGLHWRVPALAFNGPVVHLGPSLSLLNEGWVCNLVHPADKVALILGPAPGRRHVGSHYRVDHRVKGDPHSMSALLPALEACIAADRIPALWPPPAPSTSRRRPG